MGRSSSNGRQLEQRYALKPGEKLALHENTIHAMQLEILEHNPLSWIIQLAKGKPIPGITQPTPTQVEAANYALLRRVLPELKQVTVKSEGGGGDDRAVRGIVTVLQELAQLRASGRDITLVLDQAGAAQPAPAGD